MAVTNPGDAAASASVFDRYFWLTMALTAFAIAPLLFPGYFEVHSGFGPIWNLIELRASLTDLGWLPDLLENYDPWRGDGLLPYYLAAALPLAPITALKTVMGLALILGASGLYGWLKPWLGAQGATLAALVYTYAPFTLATIYVRGAWAESLLWGLAPWALMVATSWAATSRRPLPVVVAVVWFGLGLSQLGLGLWLGAFLLVLTLIFQRQALVRSLGPASIGLGLTGAIVFTRVSPTAGGAQAGQFVEHLVYPAQLFSAYWGFGVSRPGFDDGLSLGLGLAAAGLAILTVAIWRGRGDRRPAFFLGVILGLTALMLPISVPIWQLPGLAATLTYPWQLVGLAGLCLAVLAGVGPWLDVRLRLIPTLAALVIFTLSASYPFLNPQFTQFAPQKGPEAVLGDRGAATGMVTLLSHRVDVEIRGGAAGLEFERARLPLADYGAVQPGDTLRLQVDWQVVRLLAADYTVFVHLVDAQENILTQLDTQPRQGELPTSVWLPGQVIEDTYQVSIPAEAPSGPYRLYLGLYDGETLDRLPVRGDDQGRVIIDLAETGKTVITNNG
jgi:hypothetical protein